MAKKHSQGNNSTEVLEVVEKGPVPFAQKIDPLFNAMFVRIFGREDSKKIARSLVNCILERVGIDPIGESMSIAAEHTAVEGSIECRDARMDVKITSPRWFDMPKSDQPFAEGGPETLSASSREPSKRVIDLESQLYTDDIDNKMLFYSAQLITQNTFTGVKFYNLPQVVSIMLVDGWDRLPNEKGFLSVCSLGWRTIDVVGGQPPVESRATDRMMFVLVELRKFRRLYNELTEEVLSDELLTWLYLLTEGYKDDEEVRTMGFEFADVEDFARHYGKAANDPEVIHEFEYRLAAWRERMSREDFENRLKREFADEVRAEVAGQILDVLEIPQENRASILEAIAIANQKSS